MKFTEPFPFREGHTYPLHQGCLIYGLWAGLNLQSPIIRPMVLPLGLSWPTCCWTGPTYRALRSTLHIAPTRAGFDLCNTAPALMGPGLHLNTVPTLGPAPRMMPAWVTCCIQHPLQLVQELHWMQQPWGPHAVQSWTSKDAVCNIGSRPSRTGSVCSMSPRAGDTGTGMELNPAQLALHHSSGLWSQMNLTPLRQGPYELKQWLGKLAQKLLSGKGS